MPFLVEQPSLFPETLLDLDQSAGVGHLGDDGSEARQWWVLYTKARQEKAVARDLLSYRIPFYLPLLKQQRPYQGRSVTWWVPVFSGYVFLYGSEEERVRSLTTNRLSRILTVPDQTQLLADLRRLNRAIASGAPLTVESRLAPGHRVRVRRGPLAGLDGTVLVRRGRTRLLVAVNFLQQGASIEIDDYLLEPID